MPTKDRRRELRLSAQDDDTIAEAAGLLGVSISEFLLREAVAHAEAIVEAHHTIELRSQAFSEFLAILDAPAEPIDALVAQVRKGRRLDQG